MEPSRIKGNRKKKGNFRHIRLKKPQHISKKIVDKLTYNPGIHKQQKTRNLRKKLQQQTLPLNALVPNILIFYGEYISIAKITEDSGGGEGGPEGEIGLRNILSRLKKISIKC